jgi:hypothetical protein
MMQCRLFGSAASACVLTVEDWDLQVRLDDGLEVETAGHHLVRVGEDDVYFFGFVSSRECLEGRTRAAAG